MSTKAGTFYSATYSATKTPVTLLVSPAAPVSPTDILTDTSSSSHKTDAFSLSPVSKFISEDAVEFMSSAPADKGIYYTNFRVLFREKKSELYFELN